MRNGVMIICKTYKDRTPIKIVQVWTYIFGDMHLHMMVWAQEKIEEEYAQVCWHEFLGVGWEGRGEGESSGRGNRRREEIRGKNSLEREGHKSLLNACLCKLIHGCGIIIQIWSYMFIYWQVVIFICDILRKKRLTDNM